ncbi:hypothetical protein GCM10022631_41760 [Deinococcus rubellus]|uniref:DUF222 domain-containing protein n=1 Tax=Deinococcus rubellus TaxID=1889240 RepID=A0ABY5YK24_9DEIO|nr:hypothetical protein [Deinococcus rubellus]UWX65041.1 hypothetical protein N0D28_05125 [Deinococcus rubellus]
MVVEVARATVTLSRVELSGALSATVNGLAVELERAVSLLRNADTVTVMDETLAPQIIGKARAARLHSIMGRVGLPSFQHYGLAAAALCEPFPLDSLASLTEQEARRVWAHLCRCYPSARQHAA